MSQYVTSALDYLHSAPPWAVYGIVFLWMLTEGVGIGVPIEPMLLFVGAFAVRKRAIQTALAFGLSAGIALLGTLTGASIGYLIGRGAGPHLPQVGKYIGLTQDRIDHMELWLRRRGFMGVFIARIVPLCVASRPTSSAPHGSPSRSLWRERSSALFSTRPSGRAWVSILATIIRPRLATLTSSAIKAPPSSSSSSSCILSYTISGRTSPLVASCPAGIGMAPALPLSQRARRLQVTLRRK